MTPPDATTSVSEASAGFSSDSVLHASHVRVKDFRQIFHWPLALLHPDRDRAKLESWTPPEPWERNDTGASIELGGHYEEAVYFHDFVQEFLYFDQEAVSRWRRRDIEKLCVKGRRIFAETGPDRFSFEIPFKVENLELIIFRKVGVAVLSLGIRAEGSVSLADAETATDLVRRVFPGFWEDHDSDFPSRPRRAGLVPAEVEITMNGKTTTLEPQDRATVRRHLFASKAPLFLPWWREIASGLHFRGDANTGPQWRHAVDERLPVMTFMALDNTGMTDHAAFRQVSDGDWFRIAGADSSGSDRYPYNKGFLEKLRDGVFYDRFAPSDQQGDTTRQTFVGYHHALVGAGWFFETKIVNHFLGHYRQMNLIAHLEFAAMLTFSRRLTDLVKECDPQTNADEFRSRLQRIRQDFLTFTHRYHFTDVSNHLQAREMNRKLRGALGLEDLRRDVEAEIATASEFAATMDQADAARSQQSLAEVASLFLPPTLAVALSDLGIGMAETPETTDKLASLFLWGALCYFAAMQILWVLGQSKKTAAESRLVTIIKCLTVICGVAGLFLLWPHH